MELRTDLDPWKVILSYFMEINSYEIPTIIDRTGLSVNWSLSSKHNHSHKTRRNAYRPRIDAAYNILSGDDKFRVLYMISEEVSKYDFISELNDKLKVIGWFIDGDRLVPIGREVKEIFFPTGTPYDAYIKFKNIFKEAESKIIIVDNHVDGTIFTMLSAIEVRQIAIQLLTNKTYNDFELELDKFRKQFAGRSVNIKKSRNFHDRFIVIDDNKCWHVGCSIKDAGDKAFMISQLEDKMNRDALIEQIKKSWDSAS